MHALRNIAGSLGSTRLLRSEPPCSSLRSLPSLAFRRHPWRLILAIRSAARSLLVPRQKP